MGLNRAEQPEFTKITIILHEDCLKKGKYANSKNCVMVIMVLMVVGQESKLFGELLRCLKPLKSIKAH